VTVIAQTTADPVLALGLSLEVAKSMRNVPPGRTSACMVERSFDDLEAAIPEAERPRVLGRLTLGTPTQTARNE
jgi:hypothetical protein